MKIAGAQTQAKCFFPEIIHPLPPEGFFGFTPLPPPPWKFQFSLILSLKKIWLWELPFPQNFNCFL